MGFCLVSNYNSTVPIHFLSSVDIYLKINLSGKVITWLHIKINTKLKRNPKSLSISTFLALPEWAGGKIIDHLRNSNHPNPMGCSTTHAGSLKLDNLIQPQPFYVSMILWSPLFLCLLQTYPPWDFRYYFSLPATFWDKGGTICCRSHLFFLLWANKIHYSWEILTNPSSCVWICSPD